jgi:thiol-disulfide isomerase/thioredoxin
MTIVVGLIHANWCGHCQQLMPKWEEMKKRITVPHEIVEIEDSDPLKQNKIDGLNKRIQGDREISVSGYPTVFRIGNGGELEYFEKARETDELVKFFNDSATQKTKKGKTGGKGTKKRTKKRTKKGKAKTGRKGKSASSMKRKNKRKTMKKKRKTKR